MSSEKADREGFVPRARQEGTFKTVCVGLAPPNIARKDRALLEAAGDRK
jgi:hypothetical protein